MSDEELNYAPKYNKIPNIFRRSAENGGGIQAGQFGPPVVEYLRDAKWIVQEKIDGTNTRIIWDGNRVTFGTKNTLDTSNLPGLLRLLLEGTYGTPEFEQLIEQKFGDTPVTIYGEGYGHGIQQGGDYFPSAPGEGRVGFIGFDVRVDGRYVSVEDTADILRALGIDMVPTAEPVSIPQLLRDVMVDIAQERPILHLGTEKEIEGYVLRTPVPLYDARGNRVMTKIILKDVRYVLETFEDELDGWLF